MTYFIPIIIIIGLIWLRIVFINDLFCDWNYYLELHIRRLANSTTHRSNKPLLEYVKTKRLKPWKYYWRLDIWSVNKIIKDPFLSLEINQEIQDRYL